MWRKWRWTLVQLVRINQVQEILLLLWQVPDYWKTYVHEVDEEREMWLNSFYKAPLRIPMPSELEYWWSKGINSVIYTPPSPSRIQFKNFLYTSKHSFISLFFFPCLPQKIFQVSSPTSKNLPSLEPSVSSPFKVWEMSPGYVKFTMWHLNII